MLSTSTARASSATKHSAANAISASMRRPNRDSSSGRNPRLRQSREVTCDSSVRRGIAINAMMNGLCLSLPFLLGPPVLLATTLHQFGRPSTPTAALLLLVLRYMHMVTRHLSVCLGMPMAILLRVALASMPIQDHLRPRCRIVDTTVLIQPVCLRSAPMLATSITRASLKI
jgi:hypothetical protein